MTKKRKLLVSAIALALFVAACATGGRYLPAAEELGGAPEETELMARGRSAYVMECAACHRLYWPEEYTPEAWSTIAPDMADRAGLSDESGRGLTMFLMRASEKTRRDPPAPDGR